MAYSLPELSYPYDALEPTIGAETMRLHHDKHHRAYIDKLNDALKEHSDLAALSIEDLLRRLDNLPEPLRTTVRNQGGGHANHQFFWKVLTPRGSAVPIELERELVRDFGSVEAFKMTFEEAGAKHFGSGWVFLVLDPTVDRLRILTLPNQDSVLPLGLYGLLLCDLWEHAYYLGHRNRRAEWLVTWWDVVDFAYVAQRLRTARQLRRL